MMEPTAIKRTNEITSKQVLCWVRRVQVQITITQKAVLDATKNKEFDAYRHVQQNNNADYTK